MLHAQLYFLFVFEARNLIFLLLGSIKFLFLFLKIALSEKIALLLHRHVDVPCSLVVT